MDDLDWVRDIIARVTEYHEMNLKIVQCPVCGADITNLNFDWFTQPEPPRVRMVRIQCFRVECGNTMYWMREQLEDTLLDEFAKEWKD